MKSSQTPIRFHNPVGISQCPAIGLSVESIENFYLLSVQTYFPVLSM